MFKNFRKLSYNRRKNAWIAGTVLVAAIAFVLVLSSYSMEAFSGRLQPYLPSGLTFAVIAVCCVFVSSGMIADRFVGKPPIVPVLRVWIFNDCQVASADTDFDIADQLKYRDAIVQDQDPKKRATAPRYMAYFTDEPSGVFRTGTDDDYRKLARQCRLQDSRMFVPKFPSETSVIVTLPVLYRLVFGGKEAGDEAYARTYPNGR